MRAPLQSQRVLPPAYTQGKYRGSDSMLGIKKITIGIRPAHKLFRIAGDWGAAVDAVLSLRGSKPLLDPEYFTNVGRNDERMAYRVHNEGAGHSLTLTTEDVIFTKHRYGQDGSVNVDKFMTEFEAVWSAVNETLKIKTIRRVGIVAEHRVRDVDDPSRLLASALVRYPAPQHSARFTCVFENRIPKNGDEAPDPKKSAFTNLIYQFYDSEADSEVPESRAYNLNLDVQHFYAPHLTGGIVQSVHIVRRDFEAKWREFEAHLDKLGLIRR